MNTIKAKTKQYQTKELNNIVKQNTIHNKHN